ncbi:MAG: hypothetical protein GWP08_09040 [Nitrospiraceae bacterium]|nr:hypothetical protein [Nitrospiraceae bacterium]
MNFSNWTQLKSARMAALIVALALPFAALADGFYIKPHLQNITKDGATIIWETQEEGVGAVAYGPEGAASLVAEEQAPAKIHRVRIDGLSPETAYTYSVKAGDEAATGTFKTAPGEARPITFVVLGDSRRWENRWEETGIRDHMMQWNPEFVINMGDLVVRGHQYEQWPEHFERFANITDRLMMVTARGNHEGSRVRDAENDWFGKYHELPGAGEPLSTFDWGNTHFVLISYEDTIAAASLLEKDLAQTRNKHTIVAFHFPVYCSGYYSYDDSRKVVPERAMGAIAGLLDQYNVKLHLAGHTHIYERSYPIRDGKRDDANGTTYLVQGGDINCNYPDWWTAFSDDRDTMAKPTYTLVTCGDDRIESQTFVWSKTEEAVVAIDRHVICLDEAVPAAILAGLPGKQGAALVSAMDDLGAMLHAPAAEPLLAYLDAEDAAVRQAAARAIRAIGNAGVAKAIAAQLDHDDLAVRRELARALEIMMPSRLAKTVAKEVADAGQDEDVRESLIGALQFHAPAKLARDTLVKLLEGDAPAKVRRRAAYALGAIAEKGDAKLLIGLFEQEPEVFAAERLAHTLNRLTRVNVKIEGDNPVSKSKPGERDAFSKQWRARLK